MTKRKRRRFSPDENASILGRHLPDGMPISNDCDGHSPHPNPFCAWQKQIFDRQFCRRQLRLTERHYASLPGSRISA